MVKNPIWSREKPAENLQAWLRSCTRDFCETKSQLAVRVGLKLQGVGGTQLSFIQGGSAQRFKPLSFKYNYTNFHQNGTPFIYLDKN